MLVLLQLPLSNRVLMTLKHISASLSVKLTRVSDVFQVDPHMFFDPDGAETLPGMEAWSRQSLKIMQMKTHSSVSMLLLKADL